MSIIAEWVEALGGFAQKQQLVARGAQDRHLTAAVRSGVVHRARNGWYSTLPPHDPRFQAVRCGGRLTGLSAIRALGGWVLDPGPLHVSVPSNAARLRSPRDRRLQMTGQRRFGVVVHWDSPEVMEAGTASIVGVRDALRRVALDECEEVAVAAFDWAFNTRQIDIDDLAWFATVLPVRCRRVLSSVDPLCESLPESLVRTRLRECGLSVLSQALLPSGRRVDLVVEGLVGVETDGEAFHRDSFLSDRVKDLEITTVGLVPLRLPAVMVFREWVVCLAAIRAAMALHRGGNSGDRTASRPLVPVTAGQQPP